MATYALNLLVALPADREPITSRRAAARVFPVVR